MRAGRPGSGALRRGAIAALAIVGALLAGGPTPAQPRIETGRVEARAERNHARLVFSFADRPRHQVAAQPGVLVIRFERPVDVNVSAVTSSIPGYVASVRRDPDGTALRFALNRRVRVNTTEAAEQLYVDLLVEPWNGPPPPLPAEVMAEVARRAEETERLRREEVERQRRRASVGPVTLVTLEGPTFSRLDFRWVERVSPTVQRADREIRIVFDKLGTLDLGPLRARMPRFVEDVRVSDEDFRTVVTLVVAPERDVRTFAEGTSFVVDVQGPERAAGVVVSPEGALQDPPAPTEAATSLRGVDERQMTPPPEQAETGARRAGPGEPEPAARPARPRRPEAPAPATAERPPPAPPSPSVRADSAAPRATPRAGAGSAGTRLEVTARGAVVQARLQFPAETALAAFVRGKVLWIVAETAAEIDPTPFQIEAPRVVKTVSRQRVDGAEAIRIELHELVIVSAVADGSEWSILIGDAPNAGAQALETQTRQHADGRGFVTIAVERPGRVHRIADPLVGDHLIVATAFGPNASMAKPQRYVDFDLLQTAQGVVVRERVEDLTTRFGHQGFTIDRESGLALSTGALARANPLSAATAPEQRTGFVDFEGWKLGPVDRFAATRDALLRRAATAEPAQRSGARLDLARFYLAHEMGSEALSYFEFIAREDQAIERDQSFRVLRGAAAVLARRYDVADRDLADAQLEESPDVALWRGLAAAARKDWGRARRFLQRAQTVLGQYPRPLQARALRAMAEAQLELKDVASLPVVLDEVQSLDSSERGRARLALLRGRLAEASGRIDAALYAFAEARAAPVPPVAAEASFRFVTLAHRADRITRAEAVEGLASLALGWRGGDIEIEAYRMLAQFAVADGRHRDAFAAMRSASEAAPASEIVRTLQDEMKDAFADLFLGGGADRRPPLEMLALFYDYRELTPSGRRGDELIRNLAERLVDVDLLDQAIELLTHQVDRRLQGAARAEVATTLAFVHLLNREPDKAIAVLSRTRLATLPGELERRRGLIEARALAALGRAELAIELLGGEANEETQRLKVDLLFEGRRWDEAARAAEALLGEAWRRPGALPARVRADLLRAAVGYALSNDQPSLDRLRARYGARMAGTPDAASFALLAGRIENQGSEFRALARSVAQTDTMQAFLREYRERWRSPRAEPPARTSQAPTPPRG